jgi:hypothetical protein
MLTVENGQVLRVVRVFTDHHVVYRVFMEVTFWNSAEYGILWGSDFTSAEFSRIFLSLILLHGIMSQFRGIPCCFVYGIPYKESQ